MSSVPALADKVVIAFGPSTVQLSVEDRLHVSYHYGPSIMQGPSPHMTFL